VSTGIPITDPEELAWCDFAQRQEKTWRAIELTEQGLSIASFRAGAGWERAACLEIVRAAGCACWVLDRVGLFEGTFSGNKIRTRPGGTVEDLRSIEVHDPRCPHALAKRIEARERG
jgi:hypothetical protein